MFELGGDEQPDHFERAGEGENLPRSEVRPVLCRLDVRMMYCVLVCFQRVVLRF